MGEEFSFRSRQKALERFRSEVFDLLIIGGGVTGAAVARDAVSRGLSVALVEKQDFAYGTSSRSSKLIHGGLRYLETFEFGLVFESLAERSLLLKTVPHLVKPMPFYFPVYRGDKNGKFLLGMGMILYDLLALFRSPAFHRRLSASQLLNEIPGLQSQGCLGGFRYFDASMWDDVLTVEILRSAHDAGAVVANYVEAISPIWSGDRITGFSIRDREKCGRGGVIDLRAKQIVLCAGPWTDQLGLKISPRWCPKLAPSKGVHIVFDHKRLPVPGSIVMNNPKDGRIAFVMPRLDLGTGVSIVGTTDGPSPQDPDLSQVDSSDVDYLLGLVRRFFPSAEITSKDIVSAFVGVRPLIAPSKTSVLDRLQKISREHAIERGEGGVIFVAGGKYTTHRRIAEQVVDFTLETWRREKRSPNEGGIPTYLTVPRTNTPVNLAAMPDAIQNVRALAAEKGLQIPDVLIERYGADALELLEDLGGFHSASGVSSVQGAQEDPEGFPRLEAQLRYQIRHGAVIRLEDFFLRRTALYLSRADHALPWAEKLARVWAEERGFGQAEAEEELARLQAELARREGWRAKISAHRTSSHGSSKS